MGQNNTRLQRNSCLLKSIVFTATLLLLTSFGAAQQALPTTPEAQWSEFVKKHPGLLPALGDLFTKLQQGVQFPPARNQSNLLPLLPEATQYYAAFPNYGDAAHQALTIFHQQLTASPALRDWWQHGELATSGPQIEDALEKFYQVSQYVGNEIVMSGGVENPQRSFGIVAEVRKPGLKEFLQQMLKQIPSKTPPPVRVLDLQELAAAKDQSTSGQLVVLVRPDIVIAAPSVDAVRNLNSLLDTKSGHLTGTPFGQRLAHAYNGGTEILAAADLQKILKLIPSGPAQNREALDRTGITDAKYLVWEHKSVPGQPASQTELSFIGPRRGIASWLATPAPLQSLDFVSPKAIMAATVVLENLGQIFDDVKDLSTAANPNSLASLAQMEQAMNMSLKDDVLSHFDGEITLELDSFEPPDPVWKAVLKVNHTEGLQKTFDKLLLMGPAKTDQVEEGGVTYRTLRIPSPQKMVEVVYAFLDGYMVIASSRGTATEAVRLHKAGESLAKLASFRAALPPGHSEDASALFYQDPFAMTALRVRQLSPELASLLSQLTNVSTPAVMCAYGEESVIRSASSSGGMDAGVVLVGAAIAIPNLLRARSAANESAAVAMIRNLDTAQITYAMTYPQKGYARDLASLGPDPRGTGFESLRHAGLIDYALGNATCTAGVWCTHSGFRFTLKASCVQQQPCKNFVVMGTPIASDRGSRNFCSTADGLVRFELGPPLTEPITASQCRTWEPLR
jgi:hypothetical protein